MTAEVCAVTLRSITASAKKAALELEDATKGFHKSLPMMVLKPVRNVVRETSIESVRRERKESARRRVESLISRAGGLVENLEKEKADLERERRRRSSGVRAEVEEGLKEDREEHESTMRRLVARETRTLEELRACDALLERLRSEIQNARAELSARGSVQVGEKSVWERTSLQELKRLRSQRENAERAAAVLRTELREVRSILEEASENPGELAPRGRPSDANTKEAVQTRVERLRARVSLLRSAQQSSPGKAKPGTAAAVEEEARMEFEPALLEARNRRETAILQSERARDAAARTGAQLITLVETVFPAHVDDTPAAAAAHILRALLQGSGTIDWEQTKQETADMYSQAAVDQAMEFLQQARVLTIRGSNAVFAT